MKYLLLLSMFCFPATIMAQTKAQVLQNQAVADRAQEEKLAKAWQRFADAVISNDLKAIKELSAPCIRCFNCLTETEAGRNLIPVLDTPPHPEENLVSIDHFLEIHRTAIFSSQTLVRMKDTTKLNFHDYTYNADLYSDPCFLGNADLKHPGYKEVLLRVIDPSDSFEGAQQAFTFMETTKGYQFCGYSTIP